MFATGGIADAAEGERPALTISAQGCERERTSPANDPNSSLDGILVTLKGYTREALEFAARNNIRLIEEPDVRDRLESVNWRFNPAFSAVLNDPRKLCPKCESEMVLRTATRGPAAGSQFWGCSKFPRCHYTMQNAKA